MEAINIVVEQLRQAMINADGELLTTLANANLSYGHSGGQIQNKEEFITSFTSGASVFVSIELSNQVVTVIRDTAIVRHILSADTNDAGKGPGKVNIHVLLVWISDANGHWTLLARQAVKI